MDCKYCLYKKEVSRDTVYIFAEKILWNNDEDILAIGLPVGLNNSLYSLGHVALQTFNNSQGAIFMAGGAVAGRITGCSNIAITGLSSAATTFSGQNYGAKDEGRCKKIFSSLECCAV